MRKSFNGTYPITRPFGVKDPAYANYPNSAHPGTDYGLPANTPLVAGMSGVVVTYDRSPGVHVGRGKEVVITSGRNQRKTCHMNRIDVQSGQTVREGQPIGLSGHTGYVVDSQGNVGTPGGAHLHDELLVNGVYTDLEKYLKESHMDNTKPAGHVAANRIFNAVLFRGLPKAEYEKHHKGKTEKQIFDAVLASPERKALEARLASGQSEVHTLREKIKAALGIK